MRLRKFKNECYLGNPSFPSDISDIGSPDVWEPVSNISVKTDKVRKYKYKNKKVKMKNLNDKKILNQLVEKYTANGVLSAINKLYENKEFEYNGYTPAMIQSLKDDYHIEEDATSEEIEDFIDDRCMAFWAEDPNELAIQYVDQMIGNEEYDTLANFVTRYNCLDYEAIGSTYRIYLDNENDEDDAILYDMDDYKLGQYVVDNFWENSLEETIKRISRKEHFSSYIDFAQAGENMLKEFSYTTGIDENGDRFYILIFY